jgi:hypothetical protein
MKRKTEWSFRAYRDNPDFTDQIIGKSRTKYGILRQLANLPIGYKSDWGINRVVELVARGKCVKNTGW